jgi:hypothetical protein
MEMRMSSFSDILEVSLGPRDDVDLDRSPLTGG